MPPLPSTSTVADGEPSLPRPTVVRGSRTSSRASSRAGSAASSKQASSSASSPARRTRSTSSNERSSLPRRSSARTDARSSQEAAAGPSSSSTSSANLRNRSRSAEQPRPRIAIDPGDVVEISSDSSGDEEDFTVAWGTDPSARPHPSEFFEISGIRRVQPPARVIRSDLFSPSPVAGRPAEPILFDGGSRGRLIGVSADPSTGDFLTRPMPIVRPPSSAPAPGPDDSFSVVSAQVAPRPAPRSDHPITDQRLRSSNLVMPTRSPPRSKPPPIEHPLLSKYTCPICFDAPKNLCITPCGHFFCGECLFQALKTQAVQRGTMEEEDALFDFGSIFSPFAPAGTFGAGRGGTGPPTAAGPNHGAAGRGGAAAGTGRGRGGGGPGASGGGRGGSAGSGRGRNKPDPLAGQCPVCRNKIKGAFNGREKVGVLGLRLTTGKPVNDPREANGQMKDDAKAEPNDGSGTISGSEDDEMVLPTSKKALAGESIDDKSVVIDESPRAARQRRRSSNMATSSTDKQGFPAVGSKKRLRGSSTASATQAE